MKSRCVMIAVAALAVGVAAGWFAGGNANLSADGSGRARCPQRADGGGLGQAALPAERSIRECTDMLQAISEATTSKGVQR